MGDRTLSEADWQRWLRIGFSTYKTARRAERRGNIEEAKELLKEAAYSFDRAVVKILRQISAKEVSKRVTQNDLYPGDNVDKMLNERFKKVCHYKNTCKGMLKEKFNEESGKLSIFRQAELQVRAGEFHNAIHLYHHTEMPEKAVGVYLQQAEQMGDVFFRRLKIVEAAQYARRAGLEEQARALYGIVIEEYRKNGDGKSLEKVADLTLEAVGDVEAALKEYKRMGNGDCLKKAADLTLEAVGDVKAAEDLYRQTARAYLREDNYPFSISLIKRAGLAEKAYLRLVAEGKSEEAGRLCGLVEDYSRFPPSKKKEKMYALIKLEQLLDLSEETPEVVAV